MAGEMRGATLNTLHNLAFYLDTMQEDQGGYSVSDRSRSSGRSSSDRFPPAARFMIVLIAHTCRSPLAWPSSPWRRAAGRARWVQLIPFALILGIFYFVILLPMQQAAAEGGGVPGSLKVGDQVVTTGGIYGSITRVERRSPCSCRSPTRSASRSSRAGDRRATRGQDARRQPSRTARTPAMKNLTLEAHHHRRGDRALGGLGRFYPPEREDQPRARPQGRRAPGAARADRRRPAARDRDDGRAAARHADARRASPVHVSGADAPTEFARRGRAAPTTGVPRRPARQIRDWCSTARIGRPAATPSRMKPNIANQLRGGGRDAGAPDHRAPRQRARRRRADRRAARRGGDQILVQLPGRRRRHRAKDIIRSTALLELKLVEQGPFADAGDAAARRTTASLPPDMEVVAGSPTGAGSTPAHASTTWCEQAPAVTGRDLRNARPTLDENNLPGGRLLPEPGRRAQVRHAHRAEHRPPARHRPRQPGDVGADDPEPHHRRRARSPAPSRSRRRRTSSLMLRSGALPAALTYLEERTVGPTLGADSIRAGVHGVDRRAACWSRCSCSSTTS